MGTNAKTPTSPDVGSPKEGFDAERNVIMGHSLTKTEGINAAYQAYTFPQPAVSSGEPALRG